MVQMEELLERWNMMKKQPQMVLVVEEGEIERERERLGEREIGKRGKNHLKRPGKNHFYTVQRESQFIDVLIEPVRSWRPLDLINARFLSCQMWKERKSRESNAIH